MGETCINIVCIYIKTGVTHILKKIKKYVCKNEKFEISETFLHLFIIGEIMTLCPFYCMKLSYYSCQQNTRQREISKKHYNLMLL